MKKGAKKVSAKDICLDVARLPVKSVHLENNVIYALGYSDKPVEEITLKDIKGWPITEHVCFSGFSHRLGEARRLCKKEPNRMYYKLIVHDKAMSILSDEERYQWITLAKMHNLLPHYIQESSLETSNKKEDIKSLVGHFFFDISSISESLLYVYLSTLRNLREDPDLPKTVLYLFYEISMNFYIAYVLGSLLALQTVGHHILNVYRPYGSFSGLKEKVEQYIHNDLMVPIQTANSLRRFANDPLAYDSNVLEKSAYVRSANLITSINNSHRAMTPVKSLLNEHVVNAVMSLTNEDFDNHMAKYLETRKEENKSAEKSNSSSGRI